MSPRRRGGLLTSWQVKEFCIAREARLEALPPPNNSVHPTEGKLWHTGALRHSVLPEARRAPVPEHSSMGIQTPSHREGIEEGHNHVKGGIPGKSIKGDPHARDSGFKVGEQGKLGSMAIRKRWRGHQRSSQSFNRGQRW